MQRLRPCRGLTKRVARAIGDRLVLPLIGAGSGMRREQVLGNRLNEVRLTNRLEVLDHRQVERAPLSSREGVIGDLPKGVVGDLAVPVLWRTLTDALVQHAQRRFKLAREDRADILNHGNLGQGGR